MKIIFRDTDYIYGYHVSKFPTFVETARFVVENMPVNVIQLYISNGRSYNISSINAKDVVDAGAYLKSNGIKVYVHACLLYNLCGSVNHSENEKFENNLKRTKSSLAVELDIAAGLGGGVIVHPNSCKYIEEGIKTASETIESSLTEDSRETENISVELGITKEELKNRRLLILENCAKEGNKRGGTLEELFKMINGVNKNTRDQVKVCIDTAHAFGAGLYDWGDPEEVLKFYRDFEEFGIEKLELFHLNDSRKSPKKFDDAPFGSKKDRHENLGLGYIFKNRHSGLIEFFNQARIRGIPMIGEPPSKTKYGDLGPGGVRDWRFVCDLLGNTEYPLESN